MDKFEAFIREKANSGLSMEEIAKEINKAMNSIEQERKELEEKKNKVKREIEAAEDRFDRAWKARHSSSPNDFSQNEIIDLLVYAYADPAWSEKQLTWFKDTMKRNIETTLVLINKGPGAALASVLKKFDESFIENFDRETVTDFLNTILEEA